MKHHLKSVLKGVAAAGAVLAASAGVCAAEDPVEGFWMDSHGEVILQIYPCKESYCGKVAWLRLPLGPDGLLLTDYRNPEPSLRARPVCGLEVLSGFKKQPDGTLADGTVYVSDYGMTFSGYAEMLNPQQVKVTGYVALPIFGQSEVWSKVTKPFPICWIDPPPTRPQTATTR